MSAPDLETLVSLCKRRGFIFPSSEIYGGFESTWDYGPLGVELKRNVKAAWWKAMVQERDDIAGIETSILMSPLVWQASGHASLFTDALVECKSCHNEITTGNFIFRTREFEQMEMEYFCKPGTDDQWYDYWRQERMNWYLRFGVRQEHIRLREYAPDELAHYSSGTTDVEYLYPWGWAELE